MTKLFFHNLQPRVHKDSVVVFQNFPLQKQKVNKISPELSKQPVKTQILFQVEDKILMFSREKIASSMERYVKCLVIKFVDKFQRSLWMPSEGIRCAWLPRKERESRNKIGLASNRKTDDQQKIQMAVHIVSYTATKTSGKISLNHLRNICRVA